MGMSREQIQLQIKQIIERRMSDDGIKPTGISSVNMFRVTKSMRCAPAVYEPTIVAIVSGTKEAILDGQHFIYGNNQYLCCTMSMPVEAGTPQASNENPLLGIYITLDTKLMSELAIKYGNVTGVSRARRASMQPAGLNLAAWDESFSEALLRLLQLDESPADTAILADSRLRELYYAVLKGEAGASAMRAYGAGNEIARAIEYLSSHLSESITIDDIASQIGMSRAVFHRKFKQATTMSPIQFVKSMRLNDAAMKIAAGMTVNEAALCVGYVSSSQFSREFKRMYGQSPKQWGANKDLLEQAV
ncbi:AraC family transcriptional regulator [Shewanella maritima]